MSEEPTGLQGDPQRAHPPLSVIQEPQPETTNLAPPGSSLRALVRAARPRQWVKNLLLVAAPGAAGRLGDADVLLRTGIAIIAFCLVSSAMYLINDVVDAPADRLHPSKRSRPIASGHVPARAALGTSAAALAVGVGVGAILGWAFLGVLGIYVGLTLSYTLWLRRVAVLDVAVVASGFVVRAIAGGVATDTPISRWFLILVSFGSLFVVAGKRHSEYLALGEDRGSVRSTLTFYTLPYLRYMWMMSSAVAITAYCLWAFEQPHTTAGVPWSELSAVPFVLAVLRYALLLETGRGGAPEELILGDRVLMAIAVAWAVVYGVGVYLGR